MDEVLLAKSKLGLNQTDQAIKHYEAAYKRMPVDPDSSFELGKLLYKEKRYDEAINYLSKAKQILEDPNTSKSGRKNLIEAESLIKQIQDAKGRQTR